MSNPTDRRQFPRIPLKDVFVDTHNQFDRSHEMVQGTIDDISVGGLQMSFNLYDEIENNVYLWFTLPNGAQFAGIKAKVAWAGIDGTQQKAGIEFQNMGTQYEKSLAQFISDWEK